MTEPYPNYRYYPLRDPPPEWVDDLVDVVRDCRELVDSAVVDGLTSDGVLGHMRGGLERLGYRVEAGKKKKERIALPVLFGDQGQAVVRYEVDAVHDELGVLIEIEAGRGARGNAVYRDLIRSSLIVDASFLALGVMNEYRHLSSGKLITVKSYRDACDQLDAIYASQRLRLPFDGVLLFGY